MDPDVKGKKEEEAAIRHARAKVKGGTRHREPRRRRLRLSGIPWQRLKVDPDVESQEGGGSSN